MPSIAAQDLIRRAKKVRERQTPWHQHWDDLARVMVPRLLGFSEETVRGDSRVDDVFDGTPMRAARGLANALSSMLRPEGEKWFYIRADAPGISEQDDARMWLEDSEKRLMSALDNPKARVRDTLGGTDLSLVVFGTSCFFIGESDDNKNLQFRGVHLKEAAIDWDNDGDAYAMYRFHRISVRSAVDRFGMKNLGEEALNCLKYKKEDKELTYIHAVIPRKDRLVRGSLARNMEYASYWIEEASEKIVSKSGFHEFPFITPRMDLAPNENYGRSPGMIALPDSNTLQAMGETLLTAGQKAAEPPIMAPNDGSFTEANTMPGGITYYDASLASKVRGNPIFPLSMGGNIPITREMQADVREQVFAAFFRNVLNLPVSGPEMTATEVIQRKQEFLREVGPLFGRLETNYLAPMVERSFNVMLRAGGFLPVPPILTGQNIQFEYESPVKRIRTQVEAAAASMWVADTVNLSQVKPEVLDNLNEDEYVRFQHEAAKLPQRLINPAQQVDAQRQARAEQMQAEQEASEAALNVDMAKTGADAAKSLTQAGITE